MDCWGGTEARNVQAISEPSTDVTGEFDMGNLAQEDSFRRSVTTSGQSYELGNLSYPARQPIVAGMSHGLLRPEQQSRPQDPTERWPSSFEAKLDKEKNVSMGAVNAQ